MALERGEELQEGLLVEGNSCFMVAFVALNAEKLKQIP
jgi:hypothetical protein